MLGIGPPKKVSRALERDGTPTHTRTRSYTILKDAIQLQNMNAVGITKRSKLCEAVNFLEQFIEAIMQL